MRAAYAANIAAARESCADVRIETLGGLRWISYERDWGTMQETPDDWVFNLSGADLGGAVLPRANLFRAHLRGTNLNGAMLVEAACHEC